MRLSRGVSPEEALEYKDSQSTDRPELPLLCQGQCIDERSVFRPESKGARIEELHGFSLVRCIVSWTFLVNFRTLRRKRKRLKSSARTLDVTCDGTIQS